VLKPGDRYVLKPLRSETRRQGICILPRDRFITLASRQQFVQDLRTSRRLSIHMLIQKL
jgi:hypothetical protein